MAGALTTTILPTTVGGGIEDLVREDLGRGVTDSLNSIDETFQNIMSSYVGVVRSGLQRGWVFKKVFSTSISGAMKWVPNQDAGLVERGYTAGTTADAQSMWQSLVWNQANLGTFPASTESTNTGLVIRSLSLARARGNMFLPIEVMQTNELAKDLTDYVASVVRGLAMNIALRKAQAFFKPAYGYMARVSSWDVDGTSANAVTATLSSTDATVSHFVNGQVVDVYDDSAGSAPIDYSDMQSVTTGCVVDGVDYVAKTVRLVDPAGGNAIGVGTFAAGDYIVARNQTAATLSGPFGLEDWIKGDDTDTLFGGSSGIDLTYFKQFKSVVAAVNNPLDEDTLNSYVGAFITAYPGLQLDTILTTRGVTHEYLRLPSMTPKRFYFERTGEPLKFEGGWDGVGYSYDGKKFKWTMSPFIWPGRMYIVKLGGGNIKQYVPPPIPGASSDGKVGEEIQFIAGVGGLSGIFMLCHASTGAVQPMVEAPFQLMYQLAPDDVRSIKLTGLTEA